MQEINLYNLLKFYAKRWLVIATLTVLGFFIGVIYNSFIQVPLYKSTATLILINEGETRPQDSTRINNYIELFKSRKVLQPVIDDLHLSTPYDELVKSIEASNEKNTEVIKLAVATPEGETSQKVADAAIESFRKEVNTLYNQDNIKTVDKASQPDKPYNVHTMLQLGLSTAGGFLLAIIALFFVYDFKLTKKSLQEEATHTPEQKGKTTKHKRTMARKAIRSLVRMTVGNPATPLQQPRPEATPPMPQPPAIEEPAHPENMPMPPTQPEKNDIQPLVEAAEQEAAPAPLLPPFDPTIETAAHYTPRSREAQAEEPNQTQEK